MNGSIKIKEIEKSIDTKIRKLAKEYGYKFALYSLYRHYEEFFLHAICFARREREDDYIYIQMFVKPYQLDDIFWTIFDMEENINEKDSLRANGAFSAPSIRFNETCFKIEKPEEIENLCRSVILEFSAKSEQFICSIGRDVSGFLSYVSGKPDAILTKILVLVQLGDYESALQIVSNEINIDNTGGFENKGKDIYDYIRDYCSAKLKVAASTRH